MSKRAEQKALEAYPYFPTEVNLFGHKTITADGNSNDRAIYIRAYEQAEKDLALTWRDIMQIIRYFDEEDGKYEGTDNRYSPPTYEEMYNEVLRRFNEWRDKK